MAFLLHLRVAKTSFLNRKYRNNITYASQVYEKVNFRCVMANVLDCNIVVIEFEHQLYYYVYFWINILDKSLNLIIPPPCD